MKSRSRHLQMRRRRRAFTAVTDGTIVATGKTFDQVWEKVNRLAAQEVAALSTVTSVPLWVYQDAHKGVVTILSLDEETQGLITVGRYDIYN